jgi:cytochrome c553
MWLGWSAAQAEDVTPDAAEVQAAISWIFPLNAPATGDRAPLDDKIPLHVPGSSSSFTEAQLNDLFSPPDWHPQSHGPMPQIVAHGRPPKTFACGFCHMPGGQGRPENAPLAGLPAPYIVQQMADMKSGARHSARHGGAFLPAELMQKLAADVSAGDIAAAAEYFAAQTLRPRVTVMERRVIPRMQVAGWVYAVDPRGGEEALGQRLLEATPDLGRHERRDDDMRYDVFVPRGSVLRGRNMATRGMGGVAGMACVSCHGAHLEGVGLVPPLAGRSPSYLLRQLVAFQSGDRAGVGSAPMQAVVSQLRIADMIAVVAYAAAQ